MNVKYVKSGHLTKFWPSGKPDGDRGQMHSKAIVVVMMVVVVVVVVVVMVVVMVVVVVVMMVVVVKWTAMSRVMRTV